MKRKLGLKVNMTKTHIARTQKLKYLESGFYKDSKAKEWRCRLHQDSVKKFKSRLKELTSRKISGTVTGKVERISQVTRVRIIIWKQWKVLKKRQWGLQKLGIGKNEARRTAYWGDRYQLVATKSCLSRAVSKGVLTKAGLVSCLDYYNECHALKLS